MARMGRRLSRFNVHHCVCKCIKDADYFIETEDKAKIRDCMKRALEKYSSKGLFCLAYCIMDNHFHVVLGGELDLISKFFQSVGASYAPYIRRKTGTDGRFMQDRFFSEPIKNNNQLKQTIAYVLNNRTHLEGVNSPADYEFSNFQFLLDDDNENEDMTCNELRRNLVTDEDLLEQIFDKADEINEMKLEGEAKHYLWDEEAFELLKCYVGRKKAKRFYQLSKKKKSSAIKYLLSKGASMRSISRITHLTYYDVRKLVAFEI